MSTVTPLLGLIKPEYNEPAKVKDINDNMDAIDSAFLDKVYPIGSVYMSVNSTSPSIFLGGTWERITGKFLLAATDNGTAGAEQAAGNTGGTAAVTLTAAQSGLPAHSHGLNSHIHTIPQHGHSHTIKATTPTFTHSITQPTFQLPNHTHGTGDGGRPYFSITGAGTGQRSVQVGDSYWVTGSNQDPRDNVGWTSATGGVNSYPDCARTTNVGIENHSATACTMTGGVSDKAAFNSGAASGNTSSNTASIASEAHDNMPPYLSVYMWKRTA